MPPEESAALIAAYQEAATILEYGTGGSTVIAAGLPGRRVFSVESSAPWLAKMQAWFDGNPATGKLSLHLADIGKTRDWGFPADNKFVARWPGYPISVWDREYFVHPDVVLIDGRFRLACALTVLFRISRAVIALMDDYLGRPRYAQIERLVGPPEMIGRMARFQFTPMPMPADQMHWIMAAFANPN